MANSAKRRYQRIAPGPALLRVRMPLPTSTRGGGLSEARFIPLQGYREYPLEEMRRRVEEFAGELSRRRTVRDFSSRDVPRDVIERCIEAAGTAPSGANLQPWHFVAVHDSEVKGRIRVAAEAEEHEFYTRRAPRQWLDDLEPFGTDDRKPFLEVAPWLIAVFVQRTGVDEDGGAVKHYYANESVGLATGMLIAAVHEAGLVSLTHTPSPMKFLNEILERPANESPFLLLVVGYPAEGCEVPDIRRKSLDEIASFF
jgi:iodotyrosine deiodinase